MFSAIGEFFAGWKLVDKISGIFRSEVSGRLHRRRTKKRFVDESLDPVLKAADEFAGKLVSLAKDDFRSIRRVPTVGSAMTNDDFNLLLFALVKFWATIDIFRQERLTLTIGTDDRTGYFQDFLRCLESRKTRIVSRMAQLAVAELMQTERAGHRHRPTLPYIEFINLIEEDEIAQRWANPVFQMLSRTRHTSVRQRILKYGIVVHAMIDTLDPDHIVTSNRPCYPTKLSRKSWRDLKYRIFGLYLSFVDDPDKYLGERRIRRYE